MTSYDLKDLVAPVLSGIALNAAVYTTERVSALQYKMLADNGIFSLRNRCTIGEIPTTVPLVLPSSEQCGIPAITSDEITALSKDMNANVSTEKWRLECINDFTSAYANGSLTPTDVAQRVIDLRTKHEAMNPPLRAIIQQDRDDLLNSAQESTKRWSSGEALSAIDGVPIAVKDEMDQVPYATTGGTSFLARVSGVATTDSEVVRRLREAGALLIGKANMHELGLGVTGSNIHHGYARNPYNPHHHTGGSSSGSAAAVASGICPVAIGADGGGSIRIPAALCGVVGLKCTWGRVPEAGALPLCYSVGHIGPIAGCVHDAAVVYAIIAGPNENEPFTSHQPAVHLRGLKDTSSLDGLRIGVYKPFFQHASVDIVSQCNEALHKLESRGAKILEVEIPQLYEMNAAFFISIISEMKAYLTQFFPDYITEIGLTTRFPLALASSILSSDFVQAQVMRTRAISIMKNIFSKCDILATPSCGMTAPIINISSLTSDELNAETAGIIMRFCFLGNLTGIPGISVPCGYDKSGLPIGLQLQAGWWKEALILRVAATLEAMIEKKKPQIHDDLLSQRQEHN